MGRGLSIQLIRHLIVQSKKSSKLFQPIMVYMDEQENISRAFKIPG